MDALVGFLSTETLEFHYGKHHAGYVTKLNNTVEKLAPELTGLDMVGVMKGCFDSFKPKRGVYGGIFNNAAQTYNHTFYWNSMTPKPKALNHEKLMTYISQSFGSYDEFINQFKSSAAGLFGSGWTFLIFDKNSAKLRIKNYGNADCPLIEADGFVPLLTCDVWEHAYYIDYRNVRPKYLDGYCEHINWEFAIQNLENP